MSYKYKIFKIPNFLKNNKIAEYIISLIQLMGICARIDATYDDYINFLNKNLNGMILLAFDNRKIIGTLFVNGEPVSRLTDPDDSVNIQPYILRRSFVGNRDFFAKYTYYLFPMICNFCRNPDDRYKGVGRSMLQKIIERCQTDGYKSVYCIPESIVGLTDTTRDNGLCGIDDYDNHVNKYYTTNMKLIKYYQMLGFNIFDNNYAVEFCSDATGDSDYIVLNVLYIKCCSQRFIHT